MRHWSDKSIGVEREGGSERAATTLRLRELEYKRLGRLQRMLMSRPDDVSARVLGRRFNATHDAAGAAAGGRRRRRF